MRTPTPKRPHNFDYKECLQIERRDKERSKRKKVSSSVNKQQKSNRLLFMTAPTFQKTPSNAG